MMATLNALSLLSLASVLVPFVAALIIVVSPRRFAKGICISAAAIATALTLGVWSQLAASGSDSLVVNFLALNDVAIFGFVFDKVKRPSGSVFRRHRPAHLHLLGGLPQRRQPRARRCAAPPILRVLHRVHRRDGRLSVLVHRVGTACVLRGHGRLLVGPHRLLRHGDGPQVRHEGPHPHAHRVLGPVCGRRRPVLQHRHVRNIGYRRPGRVGQDGLPDPHPHRGMGQIGAAAVLHVAALRHGGSHARFRVPARRLDGQGGRRGVRARPHRCGDRAPVGRLGRRRGRYPHLPVRLLHVPSPEGYEALAGVLDHLPAGRISSWASGSTSSEATWLCRAA